MSIYIVNISSEQEEFLVQYQGDAVANAWASLYSSNDATTEIIDPGYSRQLIQWTDNIGNAAFNSQAETWSVMAVGICDAESGGQVLFVQDIADQMVGPNA